MLRTIFLMLVILVQNVCAQDRYLPNWESLDQRPIPDWFQDAKFGIFIHWGPYSVPAWSPKGTYSEWYQYWLQEPTLFGNGDFKGDEVLVYHRSTYGPEFTYYDFADTFTADFFEPEKWAQLFRRAGAKYVVLTAKHHDGYALWPSAQANDRGFAWNSLEVGAERNLVDELTRSVKAVDLKMGLYYSLYEWYHPLWKANKQKYVEEHYIPQIKDLVERMKPDVLWADGEWELSDTEWQSQKFLAWLYNESSVAETILVNDRWGKGTRGHHGGYFTTEYDFEGSNYERPWEECRGMGFSFGYNQNEDAGDYVSARSLVLMLVNIVSQGGNLLLNIGPDARGKIPPIMEDRLLELGSWLAINGEAIYGTRSWKRSHQWSMEGKRNYSPPEQYYQSGDLILKYTLDPDPGYAHKEVFFTQNDDYVFAILPKWPIDGLVIRDFNLGLDKKVTVLATGETLSFRNEGSDVYFEWPTYGLNSYKGIGSQAIVLRIEK